MRADDLDARAARLRKFQDETSIARKEINSASNIRKVDGEEAITALDNESRELRFVATHLIPAEQYQLDHEDMRRMGMAPAKIEDYFKVPVIPDIHKVIYKAVSNPGALRMATWHICDTTHCRAGWVVTLAGEAGKELERKTSTLFAAQHIYHKSGYDISPVRFFDSDVDAMADMKRLAEANEPTAKA